MEATYKIPAKNLAALRIRLEKLNARARKLGVTPVTMTETFSHTEEFFAKPEHKDFGIVSKRDWYTVVVSGESPILSGWAFVATLNHTSDGNIVGSVPGTADLPVRFRSVEPSCDHCQMIRRRNDTYVLQNVTSGDYRQVGRTCLKDFLGHADPHGIASWAEMLSAFDAAVSSMQDEDYFGGGPGDDLSLGLESFLSVTALAVRHAGWMSRAKASEFDKIATVTLVLAYTSPLNKLGQELRRDMGKVTEADEAEAAEALEWAAENLSDTTNLSDYEYNLSVVVRAGRVNSRTAGLAASLLAAAGRAKAKATEKAERSPVPVTDDRVVVAGTVLKLDTRDDGYGVKLVMTVQADEGYVLWGTVPSSLDSYENPLQTGDRVTFSAKLERSDKDETFGFYKRPTKAKVLARKVAGPSWEG
jgi:ribosomal protein L36